MLVMFVNDTCKQLKVGLYQLPANSITFMAVIIHHSAFPIFAQYIYHISTEPSH